ncbi:zinc ribbon domain-containing protein [Kallotenue papyrolyticum]|uniref:zinc ribbon domain-containing protein n=1 Tax=Kallotenue papyrolyticum TaxID=1325125 RepID=UPI0009DE633C
MPVERVQRNAARGCRPRLSGRSTPSPAPMGCRRSSRLCGMLSCHCMIDDPEEAACNRTGVRLRPMKRLAHPCQWTLSRILRTSTWYGRQEGVSVRVHMCPDCGLTLDRDVNAARNILMLAVNPARTAPPEQNMPGCSKPALGRSPL